MVYLAIILAILMARFLNKTRTGLNLRAVGKSPATADEAGINVTKYRMMAFVTSAMLAGMAGALYGFNLANVDGSMFDFNTSILILVFVVLGGMGNMLGSILAAALLTVLPELLRSLNDYRMLIYAIVLILMMLFNSAPAMVQWREQMTEKLRKTFGKEKKEG